MSKLKNVEKSNVLLTIIVSEMSIELLLNIIRDDGVYINLFILIWLKYVFYDIISLILLQFINYVLVKLPVIYTF